MPNSTGRMPTIVNITDPADPRLAEYANVKERQLAAEFGAPGLGGSPDAPQGMFYAEGRVVLEHLVQSPYQTRSVLCSPAQLQVNSASIERLPPTVPVYVLPHEQIERLAGFAIHRGLLAVGLRNPLPPLDEFLRATRRHGGPLLILENLTNHDNIGAAFRHAACFGASGVLLSPRCADPLYRKSLRVSVGLALRIDWTYAPSWPVSMNYVHLNGYETYATTPLGQSTFIDLAHSATRPAAIVIGAEGPGLDKATLALAHRTVRIPMPPGVDSLNAATTCALALYELGRATWSANP